MKKTKYIILIALIYLAAQSFFNPMGLISDITSKGTFYALSLIGLFYAFIKGQIKFKYPRKSYIFLIIGIMLSTVMASCFHAQSFKISFIAILPYFFGYLFFYMLMRFNISISKIERMLQVLTICSLVIYLINLASFPNKIFGESKDEYDMSRGFARIGVPMIEVVVTYFFYCINQWLINKKKKYAYWIMVTSVLIFMSLSRQIIAMSAILGFLFVMQKASLSKKIFVIALCFIIVFVVLPQIPMVKTMMELSENQAIDNKSDEDIRITAWRFYTTEYQTNGITPFLGNGVPSFGKSIWGNIVDKTTTIRTLGGNACFTVDVGWAGFFWYFGGVATLSLLLLIFKAIHKKKTVNMQYTSYSLLFIAITAIASGPILFYNQICSLSLILYLAYASKQNSNNNPQLQ